MYELKEEEAHPKTQWKWPHFLSGFVLLICGALIGRAVFPIEITKTLVVEKEKRVEVPVELIKYVDRRVEVPVDRVTDRVVTRYVGGTRPTTGNYTGHYEQWNLVNKGMSQRQVFDILGKPDGPPEEHGLSILYRWGGGVVVFGSFADGRLAEKISRP
jgi:hypothetical protein